MPYARETPPNNSSKAPLDYEAYKKKVIAGLLAGAHLTDENGFIGFDNQILELYAMSNSLADITLVENWREPTENDLSNIYRYR